MITYLAFFASTPFLGSAVSAVLFWLLTAVVVWGFVDVVVIPALQFESARQSLAGWIIGLMLFGPMATFGWLAVRRKVKKAVVAPQPPQFGPLSAYPYQPEPFVTPHLAASEHEDESPPPLR